MSQRKSYGKDKLCPLCGKWMNNLGYSRHRAMHTDKARAERKEKNGGGV